MGRMGWGGISRSRHAWDPELEPEPDPINETVRPFIRLLRRSSSLPSEDKLLLRAGLALAAEKAVELEGSGNSLVAVAAVVVGVLPRPLPPSLAVAAALSGEGSFAVTAWSALVRLDMASGASSSSDSPVKVR